jgi:hypothetical protein
VSVSAEVEAEAKAALSRRAIAAPKFSHLDGMAWTMGDGDVIRPVLQPWGNWLPDLDDPATLGCFELALLPEALGFEVHARPTHSMVESEPYQDEHGNVTMEFSYPVRWFVYRCEPGLVMYPIGDGGTTRAEALVAALEAAPVVGNPS